MWISNRRLIGPVAVLSVLALLTWYPLFFMFSTSFKTRQQFFENYWWFTWPLHPENYVAVWPKVSVAIVNSLFYSGTTLILVVFLSLLGGYAFGRFNFRGKNVLFLTVLSLLMVPGIVTIVPLFVQMRNMGMLNSPVAVILPWTAFDVVFGVYLMRLFFERLPKELFYAARIEGASEVQVLLHVALPLALPGLGSVAILDLLFTWNDLVWPIVAISDPAALPVTPAALKFRGSNIIDYGQLFAAYVSISIPLIVIFSFFVRRFVRGIEGI